MAENGVLIRSVSRALKVLQLVNRHQTMTMTEIAREASVPYPTACRIVQSLMSEGWMERIEGGKRYRATAQVHSLSSGFSPVDQVREEARDLLSELGKQVVWPVTISTRVGTTMMILAGTHRHSPLTQHYIEPGYTFPILECASGNAYLAFAPEDEVASVLQVVRAEREAAGEPGPQLTDSSQLFAKVRTSGFATRLRNPHAQNPGKTSAIGVPVLRDGQAAAALALVFYASAANPPDIAHKHLDALKDTAAKIGERLSA